ncbi:MAG: hypothetical protein ACKVWR_12615 [Acidimicrobiales bacterium]
MEAAAAEGLVDADEFEGRAAAAFSLLGPDPFGPPPPGLWERFVECCLALPQPRRNPFDLAIAYGAGWGRDARRGPQPGWAGRWPNAVLALVEQTAAAVREADDLLQSQLGLALLEPGERASMAGDFAVSMLGGCFCGHHRRGCKQACGRTCCFEDHDLAAWSPGTVYLRPFVDQAVRGTAQRRILGGAFAESMLYRSLEPEGRVLCRGVEALRCPVCGEDYEGPQCRTPGCRPPAEPPPLRRELSNRLFVPIPSPGGTHREGQRWRCPNRACGHLYGEGRRSRAETHDGPCPRCRAAPEGPQQSVSVWRLGTIADPAWAGDPYEGS